MKLLKLFILMVSAIVTINCEDFIFNLKQKGKVIQFDITSYDELQSVYSSDNVNNITIKFKGISCNGFRSKICLIKNNKHEIDIGSKINEVKLDVKNQLFMSLEGNTLCTNNIKFTTDITFVCDRKVTQNNITIKSDLNSCKYILELISITSCPVDDIDIQKVCNVKQLIPHSFYRVNFNRLRRLTTNYYVENKNRHFEVNICGRLTYSSKCKGNTTTICDITNLNDPKVFAVGYSINDKLIFDDKSKHFKLIQYEKAVKHHKKGRKIEIIFKCNETISPEKTKPEFISEENFKNNSNNIAYFEVATSIVCIPRKELCELIYLNERFNLNPLHKRVGNIIVPNEKSGGLFYLNVCSYLNQYNEKIPTSCTGKTSACYVDPTGKGISIGSTQIGPYYTGNSLLLNYTDGANCVDSVKWSTIINFTCSDESLLIYDSTNSNYCVHVFQWKTHTACKILFEKKNHCSVTHPKLTGTLYNLNSLKNQSFDYEINDYENNTQFYISICRPLRTPCNGNVDSAVCWFINGVEINIAIFTEEVVFDNGKIYMHMQGEPCGNVKPNSLTTIQFVCDYSDSKHINLNKDLHECIFEFIIYTKYACTPPTKTNCTVDDGSGNIYDLSQLTKLDSNYEIAIGPKKKIVLNVCHSVINNNIDGINCQFVSGICLVDSNYSFISDGYASLGDVNDAQKVGDKIIIEMKNGLYNGYIVQSIIEFTCSNQTSGPLFMELKDHKFIFSWYTPLACPTNVHKIINNQIAIYRKMSTPILINGLNYSTYLCLKNDTNCNLVESNSNGFINSGRTIILTVNENKINYTLIQSSYFYYFIHESNNTCNEKENETEKIIFYFVCGFELQMPKLEKTSCIIKVLNIDPEICSKKLECNASWYDLTPLKGNYILQNKSDKYYISMCKPGEDGVGIMMEHNGKNYSIGYQVTLPNTEMSDSVEVIFRGGDYCLEKKNVSKMYSSVIRLECDFSKSKGYPTYLAKSQDKCELQFLWRTNLVCHRKLVEFNMSTCKAYIKDVLNSIIDMKNILNTNRFFDSSTNIVYHVDFCNAFVCLNDTNCFRSMNLEFDVYRKQLIAQFKEINYAMSVINLNIKIACSNSNENLQIAKFSTNDDGVKEINTYSKDVCCIDIDCSKETNRKKNIVPYKNINIENKSFSNSENHEFSKFNLMYEPVVSIRKQIEAFNNNKTTFQKSYTQPSSNNQTNIPNMKKSASGILFYLLGVILLILLLGIWFYRWKLLKEVRRILLSSSYIRRRISRHTWIPINQRDL
ncbi:Hypothetical protein CINCED_3A025444 [Cinara cedri]|nr:Hypothetical protein CINCED_3A025444 [Cinara cedri]